MWSRNVAAIVVALVVCVCQLHYANAAPETPTDVPRITEIEETSFRVNFHEVGDGGNPPVIYRINVCENRDCTQLFTHKEVEGTGLPGSEMSAPIRNAEPGTTYYVAIGACNDDGCTAYGPQVDLTTLEEGEGTKKKKDNSAQVEVGAGFAIIMLALVFGVIGIVGYVFYQIHKDTTGPFTGRRIEEGAYAHQLDDDVDDEDDDDADLEPRRRASGASRDRRSDRDDSGSGDRGSSSLSGAANGEGKKRAASAREGASQPKPNAI